MTEERLKFLEVIVPMHKMAQLHCLEERQELCSEIRRCWKEIRSLEKSNCELIKEGEELQKTIDIIKDTIETRDI